MKESQDQINLMLTASFIGLKGNVKISKEATIIIERYLKINNLKTSLF